MLWCKAVAYIRLGMGNFSIAKPPSAWKLGLEAGVTQSVWGLRSSCRAFTLLRRCVHVRFSHPVLNSIVTWTECDNMLCYHVTNHYHFCRIIHAWSSLCKHLNPSAESGCVPTCAVSVPWLFQVIPDNFNKVLLSSEHASMLP